MNSAKSKDMRDPPGQGTLKEQSGRYFSRLRQRKQALAMEDKARANTLEDEALNLGRAIDMQVVERTNMHPNRTSLGLEAEEGQITEEGQKIPTTDNEAFAYFYSRTGIRMDCRFDWGNQLRTYMAEDFTTSVGRFILFLSEQPEIRRALVVSEDKAVDQLESEVCALLLAASPTNPLPISIRWADFPEDVLERQPLVELGTLQAKQSLEAADAQARKILGFKKPKLGNVTFPCKLQSDMPVLYWLILRACQETGTPFQTSTNSVGKILGADLFELGLDQEELNRRTRVYLSSASVVRANTFAMDLLQVVESFTDLPAYGQVTPGQAGYDGYQLTTTTLVRMFLETHEGTDSSHRRQIITGRNMHDLVENLIAKGRKCAPTASAAVGELIHGLHYLMRTYFRRRLSSYKVGQLRATDVLLTKLIQKDAPGALDMLRELLKARPARNPVAAKDIRTGQTKFDANKKPIMVRPDVHQVPFIPPINTFLGEIELNLARTFNEVFNKHSSRVPRKDALYQGPSEMNARARIQTIACRVDSILDVAYDVLYKRRNAARSAALVIARQRRSTLPDNHRDKGGVGFTAEDFAQALATVKKDPSQWGDPLDIRLQRSMLGSDTIDSRLTAEQVDRFLTLCLQPECGWFDFRRALKDATETMAIDIG